MSESQACDFQFKQGSLKDILEELDKLGNTTSTKPKVFQQLRDGLKAYCGNGYLDAFYGDRGSYRFGGSIQLLTKAGQNVSEEIRQKPSWTSSFSDPHKDHIGQTCGEKYFNALKACLPKAYAALLFLFFNVSNDCKSMQGGEWNSYSVNGSGQDLYQWLIAGSDDLPGGFTEDDLHPSKTGKDVAEQLKKAVSLTPSSTEGSLQNVLCGFMFVCSWDDALTGHACLFLSTFCEKVSGGSESLFRVAFEEKYSGKKYEELKGECSTLKSQLDSLVKGTQGGLSAVCHQNQKLFDNLWDNEKFLQYCTWLKGNLEALKKSLEKMSSEAPQWSSSTIQSGGNAGPFKYGFVFTDSSWQDGNINSKLSPLISKLTGSDSGSLGKLKRFLENPSSAGHFQPQTGGTTQSGDNSGVTAAGASVGVLGLGGAGAGAAYGLNLFGFKNLVTGLISGFLK